MSKRKDELEQLKKFYESAKKLGEAVDKYVAAGKKSDEKTEEKKDK